MHEQTLGGSGRMLDSGGDEKVVSQKIQALVMYLQSIQEKPAR